MPKIHRHCVTCATTRMPIVGRTLVTFEQFEYYGPTLLKTLNDTPDTVIIAIPASLFAKLGVLQLTELINTLEI